MGDELLTNEELADRLKVRPATVGQWARDGRIPAVRLGRKTIRFDLAAVVKALRERAEGPGRD